MKTMHTDLFAGWCGVLAGVAGFLYAVAFVVLKNSALYSLFLLLGGLLTGVVLVALYERLRMVDPAWALRGLVLGLAGAVGGLLHGGYDLANALNPPTSDPLVAANLPSQIDPRGLLTFAVAGLGLAAFAWLMGRSRTFPGGLVYLGYALAALLIVIYLGRLIILDAGSPRVLGPAALTGFLINPAWYIWLGLVLLGTRPAPVPAGVAG